MEKIKFQVETARILEILSKEIYDSPYAMLRENVQNAYDAVLMRITKEKLPKDTGLVDVNIVANEVTVTDNGIGMTETELRNNYWMAGASGKKTELALTSGVIGTFGIGAMANFGVCSKLIVETRSRESLETLISTAIREDLSISEECIRLDKRTEDRQPGTKITATLDDSNPLTLEGATRYLEEYIKYIPIKIKVNGLNLSCKDYRNELLPKKEDLYWCSSRQVHLGDSYTNVETMFDKRTSRANVIITEITNQGNKIQGEVIFDPELRSFGRIKELFWSRPDTGKRYLQVGGIANLSILTPTAGRDAISRDSIAFVQDILRIAEWEVSQQISKTEYAARKNIQFMQYVESNREYDLASRITIDIKPEETPVELGKVINHIKNRVTHYYSGTDRRRIKTFSSDGEPLLLLSQSNPETNPRAVH